MDKNALWTCKYCKEKVQYNFVFAHLKDPVHWSNPNIHIQSTNLEDIARTHFTAPKCCSSHPIDAAKWFCKHCGVEVKSCNFLSHLTSKSLHPELEIRLNSIDKKVIAEQHFDKGARLTCPKPKKKRSKPTGDLYSVRKPTPFKMEERVGDYFWTCKYCLETFTYYAAQFHLKTGSHADELASMPPERQRLFRTHFLRGGLCVRLEDVELWQCNYCGDRVAYNGMKDHLLSDAHTNDSNLDVVKTMELCQLAKEHFTKRKVLQPKVLKKPLPVEKK